jgi:hypothetical protein
LWWRGRSKARAIRNFCRLSPLVYFRHRTLLFSAATLPSQESPNSQRINAEKSVCSFQNVPKAQTRIWPDFTEEKGETMKKVLVCLLALTFTLSLTAFAQYSSNSQDNMSQTQSDQMGAKAPLMTLKGTVKTEGDKVTFVNDKDGKSWEVMNPEELKSHDGHHVQLSAHVYADKNSIHVMSVKMLKGDSMKNDSMSK